jgi:hypothetical protein
MRDCIDVGCAPNEEDCAQVGRPEYATQARKECRAYIRQLQRMFGEEPEGASLIIKSNPHDFGSYLSVVCYYDPAQPASLEYAFRCESESPREWDDQAFKGPADGLHAGRFGEVVWIT